MLFRQLEYFVAVAQERHFARAAEKCYVSQPALSAAIAKLERELNVTLINRGHSFEGLTPEGERLVVWAKRILAEHDAFKAEVDAVRSGITGTLRLGTVPTASTTASLVLSAFCSAHPLAKVQIRSRLASTELYRRLREFELDAAIVHATLTTPTTWTWSRFIRSTTCCCRRRTCCLPVHRRCRWPDAAQLPLALLTARYARPPDDRRSLRRPLHHRHPTSRNRLGRIAIRASRHRKLGVHRSAHLAVDVAGLEGRYPRGRNGRSGAESRDRAGHQLRRTGVAGRSRAQRVRTRTGAATSSSTRSCRNHASALTAALGGRAGRVEARQVPALDAGRRVEFAVDDRRAADARASVSAVAARPVW